MPIFEFKCMDCEEYFELLFMGNDDEKEVKCPKCHSENIERVVSRTNFAMATPASSPGQVAEKKTRNCSSGSCTTYTIPGEHRG